MKTIFLNKQGRADLQPDISFLDLRVKVPTTQDWMKLLRVISYLKCTRDDVLSLEADYEHALYWYVGADFVIHVDLEIHTRYVFYVGKVMTVEEYIQNIRLMQEVQQSQS